MRTIVYVDGFNLYYGSLKGRRSIRWFDMWAYFEKHLPPTCVLAKIKYFTARVAASPSDPDAPTRQDAYLRALKAHLGNRVEIIEGHFSVKNVRMPLSVPPPNTVEVIKTEEKGSDVNLAVELVNDAWLGVFDAAAVVSNDADLSRAMKIAKGKSPLKVFLFTPGAPMRKPLRMLNRWSHKQIDMLEADIALCQLPNPVLDPVTAAAITKPVNW